MESAELHPDNPLTPSFPQGRESGGLRTTQSGQNPDINPPRTDFLNNRIPACAGMTGFCCNEQSVLKSPLQE